MIAAVAALAVALLVVSVLVALAGRALDSERTAFAAERAALIRAVIARNPADYVGLEAAAGRPDRQPPRPRDDDAPPPGTQPVGLDGGSF